MPAHSPVNYLSSLERPANVAVIGSSGGIGAALCAALAEDPAVERLYAFCRGRENGGALPAASGRTRAASVDVGDEDSIAAAAEFAGAEGTLDLVVVATGILHRDTLQPERAARELDGERMLEVLRVNTVGPALIGKHFLPRLSRSGKSVFAVLSARVGSIADNRLGGWLSYRASKAALNMAVRTLAIEHRRRHPQSIVVALHPGTVDTSLSRPFSSRVPAAQLFAPEVAAGHLLRVIDGLAPVDTGGFYAWDGQPIPF